MNFIIKHKNRAYRFYVDFTDAPSFCAIGYLHNFSPTTYISYITSKIIDLKQKGKVTAAQKGLAILKCIVPEYLNTKRKIKLCDRVNGYIDRYIISGLPRGRITIGGKKYSIKRERYINPNSGNRVIEATLTLL